MNAEQILDTLKADHHMVTFAKANGEIRTMRAYAPESAFVRTAGIVPAIDADSGQWKSFRADSLISIAPFNPVL